MFNRDLAQVQLQRNLASLQSERDILTQQLENARANRLNPMLSGRLENAITILEGRLSYIEKAIPDIEARLANMTSVLYGIVTGVDGV